MFVDASVQEINSAAVEYAKNYSFQPTRNELQEMNKVYGYCRISTPRQNIERQVRNILKEYPDAMIVQETYSGTHYQGRKELEKLIRTVQAGDTIIFDSVSRMSRNIDMALHQHGHLQEDFAGEADFSQHRERMTGSCRLFLTL